MNKNIIKLVKKISFIIAFAIAIITGIFAKDNVIVRVVCAGCYGFMAWLLSYTILDNILNN